MHAVVARSTFRCQKCEKLVVSEHFLKFRCRKGGRCCGGKHISKSNVLKTGGLGALFKLRNRKSARRCGAKRVRSQNVKSTSHSDHFGRSRHNSKYSYNYSYNYITLHYTTVHYTTTTTTHANIPRYITQHQLHYITLH